MSKALKITRMENDSDGNVNVYYIFGTPPLPSTGESAAQFGGRDEIRQRLLAFNDNADENLLLQLLLAQVAIQPNGTIKGDSSIVGKTITLDVTAGTPVRFS